MGWLTLPDAVGTAQILASIGGLIFSALAYMKGREVKSIAVATGKMVDGQGALLQTAAYAKGGADQRQDTRDAAQVVRDQVADAMGPPPPADSDPKV